MEDFTPSAAITPGYLVATDMAYYIDSCPLCQSQASRHFDTREFRGYTIHNRLCAECGLVFQSPRMNAVELDEFYAAEYRWIYQGDEGPSSRDLQTQDGRASALLDFVADTILEVNRHLDIGCSAGILLGRFQDHFNCQPIGVEPGDNYRDYAQARDLRVYPDLSALFASGEERFDLISMAHVLEHLPDPVGYLSDLHENLLTAEGSLLVEVPNLYCHDSFEIAHLMNFSVHTLRETLNKAGYSVLKMFKHGRPRSKMLPLYLTVLAQPDPIKYKDKVNPERFVAKKRKIGITYRRILQKLFPRQAWVPYPEG